MNNYSFRTKSDVKCCGCIGLNILSFLEEAKTISISHDTHSWYQTKSL
jgi:hypothetical protein